MSQSIPIIEVKVGKPLKYENKMRFNDLVTLLHQKRQIKSNLIEIFPGVKVSFDLKKVSDNAFSLVVTTGYCAENWTLEHAWKFAWRFAGKVEVIIDGVSHADSFGNVEKHEYVNFKPDDEDDDEDIYRYSLETPGPFPYNGDGDKKINVEVKWTIYRQQPISVTQHEEKIPESLMSQESLSVVGAAIMKDVSTADLNILCDGKIFKAHKAFVCSRSPVFRAMLQGDMTEARKGEVTVTDVDSGTFAAVLTYVYTGELEDGQDLNNMIYAAEKYDLSGLKELLFLKIKSDDIKEEFIPDLLIIADKYQAGQLKKLAMEKIRANRKILRDKDFRVKLNNSPHIMFDIMELL